MKAGKAIVLVVVLLSIIVVVYSQLPESSVSAEENEECTTTYYSETEPVYGYINRTRDTWGSCYRSANSSYYPCVNGTEQFQSHEVISSKEIFRNTTSCSSASFDVLITRGVTTKKKRIDFSNWGVCIQENEGDCIAIICGTYRGGSEVNGIFNGCDGGKSCKKFLFCDDEVQVLVKNSNQDFVKDDPTYNLPRLDVQEVEE